MTQLNLLPDVKLEFLRTSRNKRLVIGVSLLVTAASIAALLLLGSIVYVFQKKNLSDLDGDIKTYNTQLQNTPDLDKVLTIQNQLNSLTGLHEDKAVAARLTTYLTQLTPADANISELSVDFAANTMTVTGTAKALDVVNKYVDTFKFTNYQTVSPDGTPEGEPVKAFSSVVLTQFGRDDNGASYVISVTFEPTIFDNANQTQLTVPKIITTRSSTEQPTDLFKTDTTTPAEGN